MAQAAFALKARIVPEKKSVPGSGKPLWVQLLVSNQPSFERRP